VRAAMPCNPEPDAIWAGWLIYTKDGRRYASRGRLPACRDKSREQAAGYEGENGGGRRRSGHLSPISVRRDFAFFASFAVSPSCLARSCRAHGAAWSPKKAVTAPMPCTLSRRVDGGASVGSGVGRTGGTKRMAGSGTGHDRGRGWRRPTNRAVPAAMTYTLSGLVVAPQFGSGVGCRERAKRLPGSGPGHDGGRSTDHDEVRGANRGGDAVSTVTGGWARGGPQIGRCPQPCLAP
jgi:hypothetical protein